MNNDMETTIEELKEKIRRFIIERNWEKYHNPKDLSEAICIEAAELLELFQWRSIDEIQELMKNKEFIKKIAEEIADIVIYSLSLINVTKIDLTKAIIEKLKKNEEKYPIEKYFGKAYIDE